jgi:hypothetical protein
MIWLVERVMMIMLLISTFMISIFIISNNTLGISAITISILLKLGLEFLKGPWLIFLAKLSNPNYLGGITLSLIINPNQIISHSHNHNNSNTYNINPIISICNLISSKLISILTFLFNTILIINPCDTIINIL